MPALISFTHLFVITIYVSGTLGIPDFEDYAGDRWFPNPWNREISRHRLDPKWLYSRRLRYDYDYNNARYEPYDYNNARYEPAPGWVSKEATSTANTEKLRSMKARRKYLTTGIPPRSVGYTWSKEDDMSRHPQGLRHPMFRSRQDEGAVQSGAVAPDVDKTTVFLENSRVQPFKAESALGELAANDLKPKSAGGEEEMAETAHKEENSTTIGSNKEVGHLESGVEANIIGTSEEEVKREGTDTSEETSTTEPVSENSGVEETTTPSVSDKMEDSTVDSKISKSSFSTTTVKETAATIHSTVYHSSPKEISPSVTNIPSTSVTDSDTVSPTPSTAGESSSEGISPSNTPLSSSVVTTSETVSSTPSAAGDSSSEGISPSKTPLPSSKTPLPSSTVTVSEKVSPTPSTAGDVSSKGGTSTLPTIPTTEHVIVLPRIRTARIVLSSVLLAIGLVAMAVTAVCIFRERRRRLKYDQLKLLP